MSCGNSARCGKCGVCLAVCPVYKVLMEEQASPRARIQLIKAYESGRLPSSKLLKELINKCLMCGSCAANCPSGVDHYSKFMHMRAEMAKAHGDRIEIRSLVYLLAREQRIKFAANLAQKGQGMIPESLLKKCSFGSISADRLPNLNIKPFRSSMGETIEPKGECRGTVVYFTGCATNYIFESVGKATVGLLSQMGYRVIIPKEQTCCSIPMLYHGAVDQAGDNIRQNMNCLLVEEATSVIVDCPTCGAALKKEYPMLAERYGLDPQAVNQLAEKVVDIMSFVQEHLDILELQPVSKPIPVTYHAPCHLKNVFQPSEQLIRHIAQLDYRPSGDALNCCGGGGTFFYEYPEISARMSKVKTENARKTGASFWLTDCPVCHINLHGQLGREDMLQVAHPVEMLYYLAKGTAAKGDEGE
ncbi:(Fe-S)-binding protein [Desulfogranum japonicum]|uniref:(Fe-S)-binding protein n=1 Tax=Desulfogranum japonicum TaxID=231447 RepID=UPI0004260893|nr:(Fe-S)-binding protein [Desulfogranum japonicum]